MEREIINRIETNSAGELFLGIEGKGDPFYQYIYREAAGVYWDEKYYGFKSTPLKEWSHAQWFKHIVDLVKASLGVELQLSHNASWNNIPEHEKAEISNENIAI